MSVIRDPVTGACQEEDADGKTRPEGVSDKVTREGTLRLEG